MSSALAAIVERDADWDAEFTGADWRAADVLRDRRLLLGLLREAREALSSEDEIAHGEAWDDIRKVGRGFCAYCDRPWPCHTQQAVDRLLAHLEPGVAKAAVAALNVRKAT